MLKQKRTNSIKIKITNEKNKHKRIQQFASLIAHHKFRWKKNKHKIGATSGEQKKNVTRLYAK